MYAQVGSALRQCQPPQQGLLGETHDELVAQFIYLRILRLQDTDRAALYSTAEQAEPANAMALCNDFQNYVTSCLQAQHPHPKTALNSPDKDTKSEQSEQINDSRQEVLAQHGLQLAQVGQAACAFVATLTLQERVLLCKSWGTAAQGECSGTAWRSAITVQQYRAGRLGVLHRGASVSPGYAHTVIGSWMAQSLGLVIEACNTPVITAVLDILGMQASHALEVGTAQAATL
jgi:phage gp37-like protein